MDVRKRWIDENMVNMSKIDEIFEKICIQSQYVEVFTKSTR